jgi:hypothetical protein
MAERVLMLRCEADTMLGILHEPVAPSAPVGVLIVVGGPQYRAGSHRQFVLLARALRKLGTPCFASTTAAWATVMALFALSKTSTLICALRSTRS